LVDLRSAIRQKRASQDLGVREACLDFIEPLAAGKQRLGFAFHDSRPPIGVDDADEHAVVFKQPNQAVVFAMVLNRIRLQLLAFKGKF
jgi:hypothetical protein